MDLPFQAVFENLPAAVCIAKAGRLTYANTGMVELFGYLRPEELIGKAKAELINILDTGMDETRNINPPVYCGLKKDGSTIWVQMAEKTITHADETLTLLFFSKAADQDKAQEVLETIEDGYIEVDIAGNTTFCNEQACKIFGYPRNELIGMNNRNYMDQETAKRVYQSFNKVFRTGLSVKGVAYEVIQKNGERRNVEINISQSKNHTGQCIGFKGIVRDITERVKTEREKERYRSNLEAIFRSVRDAIITVDLDMTILGANEAAEEICGLKRHQIVGFPFRNRQFACEGMCNQVLQNTLENRSTIKDYRIECRRQQRQQQIVSATTSPLMNSNGEFIGAVLVLRDITRICDLERELIDRHQFHNIIGKNSRMLEIYTLLEILANTETTVLVTGESGTGKELVTKAIHYSGYRAHEPLIKVNCSALAENLLESELFGHVKGAFTGALKDKIGRFQAAHKGTIMLDEIGDISPRIQLKLLRVLEEKEFEKVGDSKPVKVDVRVIACTNKVLEEMVRRGEFRKDLYYRLKVMEVKLPPLRERIDDIPLLVDHFKEQFNKRYQKRLAGFSENVLKLFMNYGWPGNIRELEHAIEHAFVLCNRDIIEPEHLPIEIRESTKSHFLPLQKAGIGPQELSQALKQTDGNKAKAARLLGINRKTLYRKLSKYQRGVNPA